MVKILKPDFSFDDDRGSICQLIHEGYSQINIVSSVKGAIRGNHYHKINREAFYIISGRISLFVSKDGKEEKYEFKSGDMFEIAPGVVHNFDFLEDTLLIGMYDKGVCFEDGTKDIIGV